MSNAIFSGCDIKFPDRSTEEALLLKIKLIRFSKSIIISKKLIDKIYTQAKKNPEFGIVPYISLKDSIREIIDSNNSISRERNKFILIQTPQCFYAKDLKLAYSQKFRKEFTDDASVVEKTGETIQLVEGNEENIKITKPKPQIFWGFLFYKVKHSERLPNRLLQFLNQMVW